MDIDFEKLLQDMLGAAKVVLDKRWKEARPFAEQQFKSFNDTIQMIADMKLLSLIHI